MIVRGRELTRVWKWSCDSELSTLSDPFKTENIVSGPLAGRHHHFDTHCTRKQSSPPLNEIYSKLLIKLYLESNSRRSWNTVTSEALNWKSIYQQPPRCLTGDSAPKLFPLMTLTSTGPSGPSGNALGILRYLAQYLHKRVVWSGLTEND